MGEFKSSNLNSEKMEKDHWFQVVSGDLKEHGKDADFDLFLDQLYQRLEPMLTTILANVETEVASLVQ